MHAGLRLRLPAPLPMGAYTLCLWTKLVWWCRLDNAACSLHGQPIYHHFSSGLAVVGGGHVLSVQNDPVQTASEMWRFPDRTTALGQMINGYLASNVDLDDAAVHLMFAANRWEKRYVHTELLLVTGHLGAPCSLQTHL